MPTFQQLVTFEIKTAYDSAYDLNTKKKFSQPKIYSAKGDLSKRWYVYFSYRNPETQKLERVTPIYGVANQYKTKEERFSVLLRYRDKALELLKRGYNPYETNQELYLAEQTSLRSFDDSTLYKPKDEPFEDIKKEKENQTSINDWDKESSIPSTTIKEAMDFGIHLKKNIVSNNTIANYTSTSKRFVAWMEEHYPDIKDIQDVTKKHVVQFLNSILTTTSARTRNNYRTNLAAIFKVLEDNEIVTQNVVSKTVKLHCKPNRHQRFSEKQHTEIFEYLEKTDPTLLLYIKFISYNFLRPLEVNRLKVGDVNNEKKLLQFKAKNSPLKTKIIPDILFQELPDLSKMNPEHYLFTRDGLGCEWDCKETNRRDHFSKRFKKVVKEHFGLDVNHGMYSFRHTFITKLYRKMRETKTPFEVKSDLMLITGHTSMDALEKYLRDMDVELPEDYSDLITKK